MSSIYNYAVNNLYYYSDLFLDYLLYYKITIEESRIVKNISNYIYPDEIKILKVKLCHIDGRKHRDITEKFIELYKEDELIWQNILEPEDDLDIYLDVHYKFKLNNYRAIYHYYDDNQIKFPPYDEDELEKHQDIYVNKPIFAELNYKDGIRLDITEIIKEYSGPLENFYNDKCTITHGIKVKYIKDSEGNFMLSKDDYIKITDSFANDRIFEYHDILIL